MPIYEYKCNGCGKEFEILVFNSSEEVNCPECGAKDVGRLMSGFSAKSDGAPLSGSGGSCSSCSGGSCSSCG